MRRSKEPTEVRAVPDSFAEAEDLAFLEAQRRFQEVMEEFSESKFEEMKEEVVCPACGSRDWVKDGHDTRKLFTRLGEMKIDRQRVRCRDCDRRFFPLG